MPGKRHSPEQILRKLREVEVSLGRFFQDLLVQGEIGHCSLQSCVPLFESLQPFCLVEIESAVLASPPVISVVGDTDLTYCMTNALAACNGNLGRSLFKTCSGL